MDRDLLTAILSMDTYHRGYNEGLMNAAAVTGDQIGLWTVGQSRGGEYDDFRNSARDIGFYAQSYSRDGETIIAYRGTDNGPITLGLDQQYGYSLALGDGQSAQGRMAIDFYRQIVNDLGGGDPRTANISLTGQSLGGGLAGFVGALYNRPTTVHNFMPFWDAANDAFSDASGNEYVDEFGQTQSTVDPVLRQAIYGTAEPWAPTLSQIRAVDIAGEALDYVTALRTSGSERIVETHASSLLALTPIERHTSSTEVISLFAGTLPSQKWWSVADRLWRSLFDVDVGKAVGLVAGVHGNTAIKANEWTEEYVMGVMIAYSAIDEGVRPFGDTAIRAMFDDANDLGRLYGDAEAVATYREYFQGDEFKQHLADMLVEYAGAMAFSRDQNALRRTGVIKTDATEAWLRLDLTDERWMLNPQFTGGNLFLSEIIGREEVVGYLLAGAGVAPPPGVIVAPPYSFWHDKVSPAFGREVTLEDVKVVQAALTENEDTDLDLIADADTLLQQKAFSLAVGNDGKNQIRGGYGDSILIGAKGDDTFYVETTPETPTPPPPPPSGEPPQPPSHPTVMILGGDGHDIVDHSGQAERLKLILNRIERGSIKLVLETDGGKEIAEVLDDVEELLLTSFGDTVTGSLTASGKSALADQPLVIGGGTSGVGSVGNAALADTLDFSTSPTSVFIGKSESTPDVTAAEVYTTYDPLTSTASFILNMFIPTGSTTGGGLSGATGLAFTDFEHVIGSAYDDVLVLSDLAPGGALSAADRATIETLLATPIGGFGDPVAVAAATNALVEAARLIPQNQQDVLIEAGDGRDIVIGTETGTNRIYGGEGEDQLYAGGFTSELYGGADSDFLQGGGFESQLYGGEGADIFGLAHNTVIKDATGEDYIMWGAFRLTGGVKQWWMEAGWAYYTPFTSVLNASPLGFLNATFSAVFTMLDVGASQTFRYGLSESGELVIQFARGRGGQAVIEGYTSAEQGFDFDGADFVGNIAVFQQQIVEGGRLSVADLEHYVSLALKAGFGVGIDGTDPLVLDLDGDGLELYRRDSTRVYFDLDQDGFAERTAWVRPDDGLLARDLNANGIIDNIAELFGDAATPGFEALATLDSNADGIISAADAAFGELRVWRDADSDGVTDAGELMTLVEAGITEISLADAAPQDQGLRGSTIRAEGTFTRADGSTSIIADVALLNSDTDTRYLGDTTVSVAAAALPDLAGSGNLTSLRIAMTSDAALLAEVEAFAGLTGISSWQALEASVADILFRWAGVDGLASTSLAGGLDARVLAFLETYLGYELAPRDNITGAPLVVNAAELLQAWDDILAATAARLAVQGPMSAVFSSLDYNDSLDGFHLPSASTLAEIFAAALATLPGDATAAATAWANLYGPAIGAALSSMVRHDGVDVRSDYAVQSLVAALDSAATPLLLDTLVDGLGLKNVHIGADGGDALARDEARGTHVYVGGAGNDTLTGGVGQDVYVFGTGFGTDTVIDSEPGGRESGDRLRFATLTADEVTLTKSGTDLVVLVNGTTDKVIVKDYFAAPLVTLSGGQLTPDYGIEEIQFADGMILEAGDIAARVGLGTAGNDVIEGSAIADEIEGLQGDDMLRGGDGGDLYYFTRGDGQDVIEDIMTNPLLSAPDTLLLMGNITLDDLRLTRSEDGAGDDLTIGFTWGGDSITIVDQFAYSPLGFNSRFALDSRIEALFFDRGTPIDWLTLQAATIATYTSSGDDATTGFGTPDEIFASAGNDLLVGLDGGDTYHFGIGSGQDTISDSARYVNTPFSAIVGGVDNGNDRLVFGDGIAVSDVVFSRPGGTDDLVVTLANASDSIVIQDQFRAVKLDLLSLLGVAWFDRIEEFAFADGTVLTWEDILDQLTTGTTSSDSLVGAYRQDTLDGKEGDDWLSGGDDGDTYIFGLGYGNDVIEDNRTNVLTTTADTVAFKSDIAFADTHFQRDGTTSDLLITFAGSSDTLRISNQYVVTETGPFGAHGFDTIERFTWADGTVKEWIDLAAEIVAAQKTTGNDVILGTHFDDILDGGAGDDTLIGGNGSDTYVINAGDGHDVVSDQMANILAGDDDVVSFGAGLLASDLMIERSGVDLTDARLTFASTGQSVVIESQFFYSTLNHRRHEIETIAFADGTTWTAADLREEYLNRISTSGADTIEGFYSDDVIVGGAGNDTLRGGDGSDTYLFEVGFGQDVIEEGVNNVAYDDNDMVAFGAGLFSTDAILSRSGNDLRISFTGVADHLIIAGQFSHGAWYPGFNDIELFQFGDGVTWTDVQVRELLIRQSETSGDDTITGFWTADVIDGGAGNDVLQGLGGGDTYVFGIGSGQDTVLESVGTPFEDQPDTVTFLPTVALGDVSFAHVGDDLRITIANATDTLTIVGQFAAASQRVELFKFSDGTILTAADVAAGSTQSQSTSGDDTVTGTAGDDLIDGGLGNDTLWGGDGSDTYHFGAGFGQDTIEERGLNVAISDDDTVSFASGYSSQAATLSRSGNDLIIGFVGSTDQVVVAGQFTHGAWYPGRQDIELFQFADGTQWTDADVRRMLIEQSQTPGDDVITGFWTDETLDGGAGNDVLRGLGGGDTYLFGRGSGQDTIEESYATIYEDLPDTVLFGDGLTASDLHFLKAGNDLLVSILGATDTLTIANQFDGTDQHAVEIFAFSDGTSITSDDVRVLAIAAQVTDGDDTVTGTDADDVLTGGLGNDLLEGDDGKDRYLFGASFGSDVIVDNPTVDPLDDADSVEFASGYDLDLAQFTRVGNDLIITFAGLPDQLTVRNQFLQVAWSEPIRDIETFAFGDGATLTDAEVRELLLAQAQTAGADVVTGYWTNDLIDGGTGNDTLRGLGGDDTYVFGRGYGADVIEDDNSWVAGSLADRVLFKPDVVPGDVEITRVGSDLVLSIAGTSDSLTIKSQFANGGHVAIELFEFADGTVWSVQDVKEQLLAGTPAGETLLGFQTGDTLDGRAGNDLLRGLDGGDTYVFGRDYGLDVIDDGASNIGITDPDTIRFSPAVGVGEVEFRRLGDDLGIVIAGTSDVLTVKRHFKSGSDLQRIETFQFADGTTLSYAAVNALAEAVGPDGVNRRGTVADDTMHDTAGADIFVGGLGNDTINSAGGSDTYRYALGDGSDLINERNGTTAELDRLELADINAGDVELTRNGLDLVIQILATGSVITIDDHFSVSGTNSGIDAIHFADGTIWDRADMANNVAILGTSADDVLAGTSNNERFYGLGGNDVMDGKAGSDTYIFRAGDGNDVIDESSLSVTEVDTLRLSDLLPSEVLLSHVGIDLIVDILTTGERIEVDQHFISTSSRQGIEKVEFADGTTWDYATINAEAWYRGTVGNDTISGSNYDDTFHGGLGADTFNSGTGNDRFVYASGDGNDVINETSLIGGTTDTLKLLDLKAADIQLNHVGSDLIVDILTTGERVQIKNQFSSPTSYYGIESLEFSDSSAWSRDAIIAATWYRGTSAADTINGSSFGDNIDGGAGNDTLRGNSGADRIVGGTGNDSLTGGTSNDTFTFAAGFGFDTIQDFKDNATENDIIEFSSDLFGSFSALQAAMTQSGADVIVAYDANNAVTIKNVTLANLDVDDFWFSP